MNTKLIASDLDGTILNNGKTKCDDSLFDAIRQLHAKGVHFVASSGRQLYNMKTLFEPVDDIIDYIAENGSLCELNGEIIYRGEIQHDLGVRIMQDIKDRPNCECILSCESACYMEPYNEEFVHAIRDVLKNKVALVDDLTKIEEPYLKIAFFDNKTTHDSYTYFNETFGKELKVVTGGNEWIDFIAPGSNKGLTLERLIKEMGIDAKYVMAFGDQYNDIEMLELAGTSYSMSTAAPGVNYYSDYVTDDVEDVLRDLLGDL